MKIKVTATIVLDTDKIPTVNKAGRIAIEQKAFNETLDYPARLWAWREANKQSVPDINLELL